MLSLKLILLCCLHSIFSSPSPDHCYDFTSISVPDACGSHDLTVSGKVGSLRLTSLLLWKLHALKCCLLLGFSPVWNAGHLDYRDLGKTRYQRCHYFLSCASKP